MHLSIHPLESLLNDSTVVSFHSNPVRSNKNIQSNTANWVLVTITYRTFRIKTTSTPHSALRSPNSIMALIRLSLHFLSTRFTAFNTFHPQNVCVPSSGRHSPSFHVEYHSPFVFVNALCQ